MTIVNGFMCRVPGYAGAKRKSSIDLKKVDAEDFLEALEVENVQEATSSEWKFSCPFSGHAHGDTTPSAFMNKESTAWHCHGCKRSGNAITFLAEHQGISTQWAVKFLKAEYAASFDEPKEGLLKEINDYYLSQGPSEAPLLELLDGGLVQDFYVDWADLYCEWDQVGRPKNGAFYLFGRGLEPESLMDWQFGFDDISNRFTFPVYDPVGRLVGFKGRAFWEGAKPKYKVLGDYPGDDKYGFPIYNPSLVLYGLDRVLNYAAADPDGEGIDHLILVEGEINAVKMHELGFWNTVAIGGSYLSDTHAKILRRHTRKIILFVDSDPAGYGFLFGRDNEKTGEHYPGAVEKLEPFMYVRITPDHEGDPMVMKPAEIRECVEGSKSSLEISLEMLQGEHTFAKISSSDSAEE